MNKSIKKPNLLDIITILIILVIIRYLILKFNSNLIVNGYFAIYILVFFITYYLTKNAKFAVLLSLIIVLGRIIYRKYVPSQELKDSTSFYHLIIFILGMIFIFIIIYNYDKAIKYFKYFPYIISILIILILYNLKYNKTSCCLP